MHPSKLRPGVSLLDGLNIRFDEVATPVLPRQIKSAVDAAWEAAVLQNPVLFDGPVVLCNDVRESPTHLKISWSRATYRYRTVRQIPGAPALSSMFVCVLQPAEDGRLVVGRMSATTSSPGLLQFPGGNLEPSPRGEALTIQRLRHHAAAELLEEAGIEAAPADLILWAAARSTNSNVGFFFLAPRLPVEYILEQHAAVVLRERQRGKEPEFDEVLLIAKPADLALLDARAADYLEPLIERFLANSTPE
jgi:8-oxo-dGTP pyrophosphatase MutT (NUDIX family)